MNDNFNEDFWWEGEDDPFEHHSVRQTIRPHDVDAGPQPYVEHDVLSRTWTASMFAAQRGPQPHVDDQNSRMGPQTTAAAPLHRVIAISLANEVEMLLHQQHPDPGVGDDPPNSSFNILNNVGRD